MPNPPCVYCHTLLCTSFIVNIRARFFFRCSQLAKFLNVPLLRCHTNTPLAAWWYSDHSLSGYWARNVQLWAFWVRYISFANRPCITSQSSQIFSDPYRRRDLFDLLWHCEWVRNAYRLEQHPFIWCVGRRFFFTVIYTVSQNAIWRSLQLLFLSTSHFFLSFSELFRAILHFLLNFSQFSDILSIFWIFLNFLNFSLFLPIYFIVSPIYQVSCSLPHSLFIL